MSNEQDSNTTELVKKSKFNIVLWAAIILLVASNAFTLYYLFALDKNQASEEILQKNVNNSTKTAVDEKEDVNNEEGFVDSDQDSLSDDDEINIYKTDPNNSDTDGDGFMDNVEIALGRDPLVNEAKAVIDEKISNLKKGEIYIKWNELKTKVDSSAVFKYEKLKSIIDKYNKQNQYDVQDVQKIYDKFDIYKVGVIEKGIYEGKNLLIFTFKPDGPAFRDSLYRVIQNGEDLIVLSKYSDSVYGIDSDLFLETEDIKIANLDYEKEILIPNSNIKLLSDESVPLVLLVSAKEPKKVFEQKGRTVYVNNDGCYMVELADGTAKQYNLDLKFTTPRADVRGFVGTTPNLFDITWLNDEKNIFEYTSPVGSCGVYGCYASSGFIESENQLKVTGITSTGDNIYELKDDIITGTGDQKVGVLESKYKLYGMRQDTVEFSEFLNEHPLIFWKDPFGNYIQFENAKFQPAVECGKPVIYLYPEKETDVLVYVEPSGGFSFTEPVYDNGWKVKASPDGKIYNYSDKKEYPYLFWEGRGNNYAMPEKGFVVKRENVERFLKEKLAKLGLVEKEYNEFIDFWLPKMQDKNYYFITFMPKEEFDGIAPLSVFPKPDTVIRVFMDFKGLDKPIKVTEPVIETPERVGFTVVEWGGALH